MNIDFIVFNELGFIFVFYFHIFFYSENVHTNKFFEIVFLCIQFLSIVLI